MTEQRNPTDEVLMLAWAAGETPAFEQLFQRHRRPLFTFLLHSTGSRPLAEDLFQDVFLRLVRARRRYRATGKFQTWLFTIAHNAVNDHRRRTGVRERGEDRPMSDESESEQPHPVSDDRTADPAARTETTELRERIEAALRHLSDDQREVFLLRERAGLDFQRIAEVTGAGLSTVKSRMRYALTHLRRRLEDDLPSLAECLHD